MTGGEAVVFNHILWHTSLSACVRVRGEEGIFFFFLFLTVAKQVIQVLWGVKRTWRVQQQRSHASAPKEITACCLLCRTKEQQNPGRDCKHALRKLVLAPCQDKIFAKTCHAKQGFYSTVAILHRGQQCTLIFHKYMRWVINHSHASGANSVTNLHARQHWFEPFRKWQ